MTEKVSEFECAGKNYTVFRTEDGLYSVYADDCLVQPNHDSDGIIRYLSHIIFNLDYCLNNKKS